MRDSSPHSVRDDLRLVRAALGYPPLPAYVDALNRIEEQLESKERLLDLASEMGHSLEEQLERAEKFIAHQGMEYRFAEWCGGVANPASVEAAQTCAVSPAPGHQRSDHPEPSPDTSPASSREAFHDTRADDFASRYLRDDEWPDAEGWPPAPTSPASEPKESSDASV